MDRRSHGDDGLSRRATGSNRQASVGQDGTSKDGLANRAEMLRQRLPPKAHFICAAAAATLLAIGILLGFCVEHAEVSGEKEFFVRTYLKNLEVDARLKPVSEDFWLNVYCCCNKSEYDEVKKKVDTQSYNVSYSDSPCLFSEEECDTSKFVSVTDLRYQCHWSKRNASMIFPLAMSKQSEGRTYQLLLSDSMNWQPLLARWNYSVMERYMVMTEAPATQADFDTAVKEIIDKVEKKAITTKATSAAGQRKPLFYVKANQNYVRAQLKARNVGTFVGTFYEDMETNTSEIYKYVKDALSMTPQGDTSRESWANRNVKPGVIFEELYDMTASSLKLRVQVMWGRWVMALASDLSGKSAPVKYWAINARPEPAVGGPTGIFADKSRNNSHYTVTSCEVDRKGCSLKKSVELLLPECIMQAESLAEILKIPWLRADFFLMGTQGVKMNRVMYEAEKDLEMPYLDRHLADFYASAFMRAGYLYKSPRSTLRQVTFCDAPAQDTLHCYPSASELPPTRGPATTTTITTTTTTPTEGGGGVLRDTFAVRDAPSLDYREADL